MSYYTDKMSYTFFFLCQYFTFQFCGVFIKQNMKKIKLKFLDNNNIGNPIDNPFIY